MKILFVLLFLCSCSSYEYVASPANPADLGTFDIKEPNPTHNK